MNTLEINFNRLLRSRDLDGAVKALEKWAAVDSMDEPTRACWMSLVDFMRGDVVEAINRVSPFIESGKDRNQLCRSRRAGYAYYSGDFAQALVDYNAILADETPLIASMLHLTARFRVAYILARQGDESAPSEINKLDAGYSEVVDGTETGAEQLLALYEIAHTSRQMRQSPGRRQPG